jgi:mono/diheme cytochrome c family protein
MGIRDLRRPSRLGAIGFLLVVMAIASACQPGPYPIDILPEMHYQVSQRMLEPDRLAPPSDAIPTNARLPLGYSTNAAHTPMTWEQAATRTNSVPRDQGLERGRQLFAVNCAACHGKDGHGQSVVAEHFRARGFVPPVDFTSQRAQSRSDGQLYWIIVNGLGNMPPFGDLLTDEDVWSAVYAIREVQGR